MSATTGHFTRLIYTLNLMHCKEKMLNYFKIGLYTVVLNYSCSPINSSNKSQET
jgi:hypothetical protein